jgi:ferric-dicitrate binding protein FerR (iron transport regulator)
MKNILNILRNRKTKNEDFDLNIDTLLKDHNLSYSEINFEKKETDILKSFDNLNSQINKSTNYIHNLKSFIPYFNYKAVLKPAYTIILTTIIIFAVIEFKEINKDVEYAEIRVDEGEKITLHLNDNFTIWLNSESSIKIPMELNSSSKIYLDGEAYFEIKNGNKKTPEIIAKNIIFKTKQGDFNINSNYKNNQLISTIKQGNIELYNPHMPQSTKLLVNSGERITYNPIAEFISIEKENNINYLAWKTGILNFDNTSLKEVSETISCYFNIPVQVINPDLKYKKITASFNNADIDEILEKLQITLNCEISGDGSKLIIN